MTARHKLLSCCVLLATRPPFYSLNFYAVKTEGLLYTHQPLHFHNLLKSTSTASPYAKLASPRKRGGGTAVEVFRLAVQYSDSPAFTILKLFRAVTVGIAPYLHQPFQNRTIPPTFRRASVCVCLYGFVSALSLAQHHVLASPRKRGGGTAVEVFQLAVQYSDSPAFTILKLFRAVTVGIAPYPHQPSQTRTIPRKPPTPSPP